MTHAFLLLCISSAAYSVLHRCGDTRFHFKFSFRSYLNDASLNLTKNHLFLNVFVASFAYVGYREQCLHAHLFSWVINQFKLKKNQPKSARRHLLNSVYEMLKISFLVAGKLKRTTQ